MKIQESEIWIHMWTAIFTSLWNDNALINTPNNDAWLPNIVFSIITDYSDDTGIFPS